MSEPRRLIDLTDADLERLLEPFVRRLVREEIAALVGPRFLTTAQVATMLGVSDRYVLELVRDQGLPTARSLGRHPRFDRNAVAEWMLARPATVTPLKRVK